MRKRIEELAAGKIPYEQPQIVFSREKLELKVVEGQDITDSFQIKSENGIPMKGIIYSTSSRMECLTPQFQGEEATIRIEFHGQGMAEGDLETGELYVVLNGGEYQLSYAVTATRLYAEAATGLIRTLGDFAKLAREDWDEAYRVFHSPAFRNVFTARDFKATLLYQGLGKQALTVQTMDEFLIGIGKKERADFTLEKKSAEYFEVKRSIEEQLCIFKEGEGYLEIYVTSSDPFLIPQKRYLTNEDFVGSTCTFTFYVDVEAMHAGNNFASICFENDIRREEFQVWVSADSIEVRRERTYQTFQRIQLELVQCYVDYRLKKIVTGEWTNRTVELLDRTEQLNPGNEWYLLFKAYALLSNRQRQDAEWLMNDFRQRMRDRKRPQWAFYDYLCLMNENEPVAIDKLVKEIESISRRYSSHPVIFFLTLQMNGTLRDNPQARARLLEERILSGQYTPLWYVEAFQLYVEEPYLLTRLEKYEILLMNWASRQGVLTKDLADQINRLANNMRQFNTLVFHILCRCYDMFPDEDMLAGVCAYLIKGQRYQVRYHHWFEKGVEESLKITGLYEAYLLTMDLHTLKPLPKVIQMYFQYNNQLPYQYKAALYRNIIAHKDEQPMIYEKYVETMKQFSIDEILKGNIDDNLSVIYEEMLDKGILTKELAGYLAEVLYTHKFYCTNPSAAYVVVIQKHIQGEQRVAILNGVAYFQLFSNDYAIILEDRRGQRFVQPQTCELEKLMKPSHYIRRCLNLAPDRLPFLMHHIDGKTDLTMPQRTDVEYMMVLMGAPQISTAFKTQIGPGLVRYCLMNHMEDHVADYLTQIDFSGFGRTSRNALIELMIDHGRYDKAYQLLCTYGFGQLNDQRLAVLAAYIIQTTDVGEDAFLLELSMHTFLAGVRNVQVLAYLAKYYEGPSKQMMLVYKAAVEADITDLVDLEERLLVQTLYSTEYVSEIQEVYQGYEEHHGRDFVLQAYRSYCMHEYVVSDMVIPRNLFLEAYQLQKLGKLRGAACKLGLLKYFSECEQLDRGQLREADELLNEFTSRNMNFAFFKRLPEVLCSRYQLSSRMLVEYHARPDSRIQIHYRMPKEQKEFTTATMPNIYDGIFTWEFLLFRDDEVEYYITEEVANGTQQLGESRRAGGITYQDVKHGGRYAFINRMLGLRGQEDTTEMLGLMREYQKLDIVTDKVFRII